VRHLNSAMPVVFVIASDSKMRTAVRAELRERGIDGIGMDSANDIAAWVRAGVLPDVMVLEATEELISDMRIQNLLQRVPAVLIVSRTVDLNASLPPVAFILYRPVLVGDIIKCVSEILSQGHTV
jgi:hypothetical protein